MRIGIDISQLAYEQTGVANYLSELVNELLSIDKKNKYVLFYSSLRREFKSPLHILSNPNVTVKKFKFPPTVLDILWNRLHILPIEDLMGDIDIFISSDWTQPPTRKAKIATILYDMIVYKHPEETDSRIVQTQKRRLKWVKKECDLILCISEATKKDAREILGIDEKRLKIAYPGVRL